MNDNRQYVESEYSFLVKDYGLKYLFQEFKNCFGGHWFVNTYSYYNENGCFTIQSIPQKDEFAFYYSPSFCNKLDDLCAIEIDVIKSATAFGLYKDFLLCINQKNVY